jgi:hypothetical protein
VAEICDICEEPIAKPKGQWDKTERVGVEMCPSCFDEDVRARDRRQRETRASRPSMSLLRLMAPAVRAGQGSRERAPC